MRHRSLKQRLLKISSILISLFAATDVMAMSGPFEHPAQAVLKDGTPCFFADFGEGPWSGYNLTVAVNKGPAAGLVWAVSTKESEQPSTSQSCIPYGQSKEPAKTIKPAIPLRDGLPYLAIIHLGDRARYGVRFCTGKDVQGHPTLTTWNEDGNRCTETPLNDADRPSFWQRTLGK